MATKEQTEGTTITTTIKPLQNKTKGRIKINLEGTKQGSETELGTGCADKASSCFLPWND